MEMVRVVEIEGRGRGLVASQPLRGGQIILKESPILLYSAFPLTLTLTNNTYCANCFKTLPSSSFSQSQSQSQSCPSCCLEVFCSPQCYSHSQSHSHTQWACQTLLRLRHALSSEAVAVERHQQSRFLVAAYNLALHSPALFHTLLSLHGSPDSDPAAAQFLHPLLSLPPDFSVETSAALLAKDKLNAFGLMEPFSGETSGGGRSVRAYGIYPRASLFNHDCLPNACRFDYVDSDSNANTDISVRMIHDVPAGRETRVSYFPVNLNYRSRQRRLREDYGFACDCDRCKVEANWSDQEEDDNANMEQEGGEEDNVVVDMEDEEEEENATMEEEDEDCSFPHAYFFARYMCNRNNCGGTLAPLPPPPHAPSSSCGDDDDDVVMECNVCGNLQTHHN